MIDNHYFSNIGYYIYLLKNKKVVLNPNYPYQKGWFGNKCEVVGANGVHSLSVPLLGGRNQKAVFKDVKIAYHQPWQLQHYKTLLSCYGNSPYFNHYKNEVEKLFSTRFEKLFDLNIHIAKTMLRLLKCDTEIVVQNESLEITTIIFSKKHIAQNPVFNDSGIRYPQVFEDRLGFVANLSILDLLFCMGPQAKNLLLKYSSCEAE